MSENKNIDIRFECLQLAARYENILSNEIISLAKTYTDFVLKKKLLNLVVKL